MAIWLDFYNYVVFLQTFFPNILNIGSASRLQSIQRNIKNM